ncbi:hypothetical protein [Leucobacter sp. cx-169]|uniref:hypothetical protein n=1 Tax=Leucobacter sp. cx-169 TaxID=2770549 RepID=UPI00165DB53F|nr:hypothetical protein [Leucobacter sp. cx-169]MBC9927362.1 hypothetical protein [Leucobacter sp. cx-169]
MIKRERSGKVVAGQKVGGRFASHWRNEATAPPISSADQMLEPQEGAALKRSFFPKKLTAQELEVNPWAHLARESQKSPARQRLDRAVSAEGLILASAGAVAVAGLAVGVMNALSMFG